MELVYTNTPLVDQINNPPPMRSLARQRFGPVDRFISSVPLYVQIAESLFDRIESGELAAGRRLPPERELSQMLGVNRMTLRQALHSLEVQGFLVRRQGDGTYVADPKIERQAGKLVSFTRNMARRGFAPGAKVVRFEQRPAESSLARELHIRVSAPVYDVHRLRLIKQDPVVLEHFMLPVARFPALGRFDLAKRSLYEVLETEYRVAISRARQSLEPTVATTYEAQLLKVKEGAPLMLEVRVSFDQEGRPVEYGRDLYRGDRFRFITEMAPLES